MMDPAGLYRGGKRILAPMVRAGTLPFRELCFEYGADVVYGEELIDRAVMACTRVEREDGRVEFVKGGEGRALFAVRPENAARTVFQLGTSTAQYALEAAQLVAGDVAGVDVNMGCPKQFSVQGGMGAELMRHPGNVRDILRTLRLNLPAEKSVTCKIRLLPDPRDTVEFCRMVEQCGVTAVAVHGRTRDERDQHPAKWEQIKLVKSVLGCPVVLNGDVFCFADFERALRETGVDAVMTARGALANASIFSADRGTDVLTVARRYVELAGQVDNNYPNTKWTVLRMLGGVSRKEKQHKDLMDRITNCRDHATLVAIIAEGGAGAPEAVAKKQRL
jgi:tRNA-dihydrouridine synthase 2